MDSLVKAVPPSVNGWNAEYLEEQYQRWRLDPRAVSEDMASFFQGFDLARAGAGRAQSAPAPTAPIAMRSTGGSVEGPAARAQVAVLDLIRAYRTLGHLASELDPFGREREAPQELTPQFHGLGEQDLDRAFDAGDLPLERPATLRQIIEFLDQTYCRTVGVEFMHIESAPEREWVRRRVESTRNRPTLTPGERVHVLYQLHRSEMFETFLHKRYVGQKRFSLEGGESLIPLMDRLVERASDAGMEQLVIGMPHRGRLNVLNNILGKTYEQIFTEFEHSWEEDFVEGGGDVKYHLGYSSDRTLRNGRQIRVALSANPSHLEAVNAVVEGRTRAKQRLRSDDAHEKIAALLIHGDAAFIAQGVVMEVLNFSQLEGYTTGGTVHVVVNNLIGFTTGPEDGRSSRYCTDIAKMIDAPILHVNGEDPEAVVHCADIALEYRQTFKKDVVIDMWCYRKYGHNEGDDASFTQPVMARLIQSKPSVLRTYAERLLGEGVIKEKDVEEIRQSLEDQMERAQSSAIAAPQDPSIDPGSRRWEGFGRRYSHEPVETGVPRGALNEVAASFERWPKHFTVHKNLARLLHKRAESVQKNEPLDWGTAEMLAYGSLLLEGVPVRLSGQDSRRGTFSHRHAVIRDMETGEPFVQLNHMREAGLPGVEGEQPGDPGADGRARQAEIAVYDSPLSEYSVLGFEYGFSLADPSMLVIWEAQFGDFANGAQVVIDQFLASAELKWQRWSGLVMLLPHAYEGQGPEHSSARLERFLQLCADNNMQVVYPTTPAQNFHVLRRQLRRPFRKPLIIMSPKSLLRLPEATSAVQDLVAGRFSEVLDDPVYASGERDRRKVKRVVLCSGKVYYDLVRQREEAGRDDLAIVRLEQLYPLHDGLLRGVVTAYPESAERVWVQEEPKNAGAYTYIAGAARDILGWPNLPYIGRNPSSTPATGSKEQHDTEQRQLLEAAVGKAVRQTVAAH